MTRVHEFWYAIANRNDMSKWGAALQFTGVGFFIALSIFLGVFLGLWFDEKLGTKLLWLVGLFIGLGVAFYGVFKMLLPLLDKRNKEK